MWVYKQTETAADQNWQGPGLWTVGHYEGSAFVPESDHDSPDAAAARVHYLNGGSNHLQNRLASLETSVRILHGYHP